MLVRPRKLYNSNYITSVNVWIGLVRFSSDHWLNWGGTYLILNKIKSHTFLWRWLLDLLCVITRFLPSVTTSPGARLAVIVLARTDTNPITYELFGNDRVHKFLIQSTQRKSSWCISCLFEDRGEIFIIRAMICERGWKLIILDWLIVRPQSIMSSWNAYSNSAKSSSWRLDGLRLGWLRLGVH